MQTFLISSSNPEFIEKKVASISKNLKVSPANLIKLDPITSLSISDVRKISQIISLKPFGGGERLIIIYGLQKATPEASNALLKFLEEPPAGNFFILVTENVNKLLPTIISRCQIISDTERIDNKSFDSSKTKKILRQILFSSEGERILINQKVANTREEGIQFLNNLLTTLEELLHKPDKEIDLTPKETAEIITKVITAKNYLERYINFKATLDILFLGFPKVKRSPTLRSGHQLF